MGLDEVLQVVLGHTRAMIFKVVALIASLLGSITLLPGTVILTGTPEGVVAKRWAGVGGAP